MPRSLLEPLARRARLLLAQARVTDLLQGFVERRRVVAAVVRQHAEPRVVGEILGLDEVAPSHLGRIDPGGVRNQIAGALDDKRRLRPARAPVGVDHGRVGVDPFHIDVDVRDLVAAGHHPPVERGRDARRDRREVRAEVRQGRDLQRRDLAVLRGADLDVGVMVATVRGVQVVLGAILEELHRAAELLRQATAPAACRSRGRSWSRTRRRRPAR